MFGETTINKPAMADKSPPISPRDFDGGAVGLAIVAAMGAVAKPIPPQRSVPIQIVSPRTRDAAAIAAKEDDDEMSESYTCVVSHVAGSAVRKRVYFDDGSNGAFFHSPQLMTVKPKAMEFLNRCYICANSLHGLDIFIYRGDKAFCSSECRSQQILNDEYMEKRSSGALNQFEYSLSPYSAPLLFPVHVAAA